MSQVLLDTSGGIARITLNRPQHGNAIDLPMARALAEAASACADDAAVRCVLLIGAGRLFCAGGDIAEFAAAEDARSEYLAELAGTFHRALSDFAAMAKPFVVAVNGPAAGAGLSLALAGDIVLAARSAHFTVAYSAIGLTPDGGCTWMLPRLIGLRRAQELLLTNRRVAAEEAVAIGLVTRLVEDEALVADARHCAERLADGATGALGEIRRLLQHGQAGDLAGQLDREASSISRQAGGAEAREGIAAYLAKRAPDFRKVPSDG